MEKAEKKDHSLIFGILSIVLFFIPFIGLLLGVIGIALALSARKRKSNAGLAVSIVGVVIGIFVIILLFSAANAIDNALSTEPVTQPQFFDIRETKKIDNYISVTVERIGLVELRSEKYIRVDIVVENIGDEKIAYYSPNPVILGKSSNQFDEKWDFSDDAFDSGDIHPGVIKKGAVSFEVEEDSKLDVDELIISTGLSSYEKERREIGMGQALMYDKEIVFKYDISHIRLQ